MDLDLTGSKKAVFHDFFHVTLLSKIVVLSIVVMVATVPKKT